MKENIFEMVMDRAMRHPDKDVFKYRKGSSNEYGLITWGEMGYTCQKVSQALLSLGFRENVKIGIFSENRPEWLMADIGIIGIRGVSVPLYATSSKQHLNFISKETELSLLFVGNQEQYEKALWLLETSGTLKFIVLFDSDLKPANERCMSWQTFLELGNSDEASQIRNKILESALPEDMVTIIFTSGTTGDSKGVMLTHTSFFYTFKIHDERLHVSEEEISLSFLPLSHVFERLWSYFILFHSALNVFINNPREVIQQLPRVKPTVMCTVPRFFEKTKEGIDTEMAKWPAIKRKIFLWSIKTGGKYSEYLSKNKNAPLGIKLQRAIAYLLVLKKLRNIFGGRIRFMPCAGAAISPQLLRFFHAAGIFVNYGYGATETSATVSCFRTDRYDFDSCGTIMPGIEVKISEEGEILIKGKNTFTGYYNRPDDTAKALKDGWYFSGDIGFITPQGDLVMTDRIKDLIKTSGGKYVSPQKIELLLTQEVCIEQAVVIGERRKYVTALIVPSFEALKRVAQTMGIADTEPMGLIKNQKILEYFQNRIDAIQEEFLPYEKIIRFTLLAEPFTIQNGMLTNTLKVKRNVLVEHYKDLIDGMYSA